MPNLPRLIHLIPVAAGLCWAAGAAVCDATTFMGFAPRADAWWTVDDHWIDQVDRARQASPGRRAPDLRFDIDRSGRVDDRDLAIYRANLGRSFAGPEHYVEGQVLVRFRDALEERPRALAARADQLARRFGGRLDRLDSLTAVARLTFDHLPPEPTPAAWTLFELCVLMQAEEVVDYAEPNGYVYALFTPNDPRFSSQWNFHMLQMSEVWDIEQGRPDVIVAVIDTGVAFEDWSTFQAAPDLRGTSFVPGWDAVELDGHPNDENGHGTHVAGTVAQTTDNGEGVAGMCPRCSIMPIRVLDGSGTGTEADVAAGIRWAAEQGARVINLSLGGPTSAQVLEEAVTDALARNIVVVAAAGNGGADGVGDPVSLYPARYEGVLSVGAIRYDEQRAFYSNYGPDLDLVAPGGDSLVDQNGDGLPDGILQNTFLIPGLINIFGYSPFYQGTSMAAPHVAATAALLIAAGVESAGRVRDILLETAVDLGEPGWDPTFGNGRLNPLGALERARDDGGDDDDGWGWTAN